MRLRNVMFGFAAVAIGLAAGLAIAEAALQFLYRSGVYASFLPPGMRDESGHRLNWVRLTPDFAGVLDGIEYRTNALGYRDDPIDPKAAHIVFLGDSTTFGYGLSHADSFPERAEALMNARGGRRWQSVNTGSPGQSTLDERDIWTSALANKDLDIKLAVLGFYINDFTDNHLYAEFVERYPTSLLFRLKFVLYKLRTVRFAKEYGRLLLYYIDQNSVYVDSKSNPTAPSATTTDSTNASATAAASLLDAHGQYKLQPGKETEWDWVPADKLPQVRVFRITTDALDAIAASAKARGIPAVLLYVPSEEREVTSAWEPQYKIALREHVRRRGDMTFVDPVPRFKAELAGGGADPVGTYVGHIGPKAAALVAEVLVEQAAALGVGR